MQKMRLWRLGSPGAEPRPPAEPFVVAQFSRAVMRIACGQSKSSSYTGQPAPLARMQHIFHKIQTARRPNCSTLARDLEVSPKTVQRDIDFSDSRWSYPSNMIASNPGFILKVLSLGFRQSRSPKPSWLRYLSLGRRSSSTQVRPFRNR
jgi:hypothetical protein